MPRCLQPAKLLPYRVISHTRYQFKDLPRLFSREKTLKILNYKTWGYYLFPRLFLICSSFEIAIFEHEFFSQIEHVKQCIYTGRD